MPAVAPAIRRWAAIGIAAGLTFAAIAAAAAPAPANDYSNVEIVFDHAEAHRNAVELARRGHPQRAAQVLQRLVTRYPQQPAYLHDLLVIAHWAGEHQKALDFSTRLQVATAPPYVLEALGSAARELGRLPDALAWYEHAARREPARLSVQVARAHLLTELQRGGDAVALTEALVREHPRAPQAWLARGHALRHQDEWTQSLLAYVKAHELQPADPQPIIAQVILLRRLGAPHQAAALLARHSHRLEPAERAALLQDRAARTYRWGAHDPAPMAVRAAALDDALRQIDSNLERPDIRDSQPRRDAQRIDRLIALSERRRYADAVALYEALAAEGVAIPAYGLAPAATAYSALRRPHQALALFERTLAEDPDHFDWQLGRFYALADAGRLAEAQRAVDRLLESTPQLKDAWSPRLARENIDHRIAATAQAQARAYAEQYAEAHRLLDALVRSEPYDSGVHNAAAWLAEWRGLPRSAQQQFEYVLAVDPANADAHAGLAAARTATGDIAGARNALEHAEQVDPAHPGAVDARLKYRLATAASVAAAAEHRQDFRARQTLTGLRAATPLVSDHWRLTAGIDWLEGRLDGGGQVSDRWPMVGLQWLARDVSAQLAAQRYRYADRTGVAASVEWSVDDHWRVRAGAASAARDVPLQAIAAGIHARQASIGASWRRDEGRLLSLDARRQAFSDGNRRNEVSAAWSERLREWTDARLSVNALLHSMTNTIDAAPYFNPRRGLTGSAELLYEHAGWRLLDRWLWHELGVTVGAFDQSGFRTTSIGALRYGLRWRPDTWTDIRLGYLLTRRAYDGEYGTYHQATLSVLRRF